ncbi:hypothetical protein VAE151_150024 [Vibrio aestuarianus]|nr:hypothetical protein VAE151_150024 [Vibrio aestuarianus]
MAVGWLTVVRKTCLTNLENMILSKAQHQTTSLLQATFLE